MPQLLRTGGRLLAAGLLVVAAPAIPAAASASPPGRVPLPSPNVADLTGTPVPLAPDTVVPLRVYLTPRAGLADTATSVSTPGSADYTHFLTPGQFRQRYAPSTAVSSWLAGQGMTVTATTPHYIGVSATVAEVDAAFQTRVSSYDTTRTIGGQPFVIHQPGVVGGFSAPAAVAAQITSVTGIEQLDLSNLPAPAPKPAPARRSLTTDAGCSHFWGEHTVTIPAAYGHTKAPTTLCGYTPDQVRSAYGVKSYTGKGRTIAIIWHGHLAHMESDVNRFFDEHGDAGFAPGQYAENIGPDVDDTCGPDSGDVEEANNITSAHIGAPDAKIVYVAVNCTPTIEALLESWLDGAYRVVDGHLADVVSISGGLKESTLSPAQIAPWAAMLEQGAVEGIGFTFAAGDEGDLGLSGGFDEHDLWFPASSPWVTAVGGTSLAIGRDGKVAGEYAWGDNIARIDADRTGYETPPPGDFNWGGGGGISQVFAQPAYQKGTVPAALSRTARVMPDISADAGFAWLIGFTDPCPPNDTAQVRPFDSCGSPAYTEVAGGGGTSAASPLIAALEADAMQGAGHAFGFANPLLYRIGTGAAIRDLAPVNPADPPIVVGDQASGGSFDPDALITLGENSTLASRDGYDDATGLGAAGPSLVSAMMHP
ncbi:S8 family serine peptidase [Actinoplanes sp. TBRC 11911]|uniref:S53 family peptidase n=1 Tax=Actinoplanes sp. TBRC 11911 TaxID=2729386 RepID=UPI00145FA93B|nr:protease pro-enzyme activation domain-containing protein [Actinoplanes sp. TBRC 11911]NMO53685.1 S8 family serine peptidase [Actinoplanes sp. TBRC 11911]